MFDNLKGMAGIAGLMKDLPRIKEAMEEVKANLRDLRVDAETGGGAVRAVASGDLQIVSINIDAAMLGGLVDPEADGDRALAQELIVGAVNAALRKAREAAEQEFSSKANELGMPIPAGGLGGLLS